MTLGQGCEHLGLDEAPGGVVVAETSPGLLHYPAGFRHRQSEPGHPVVDGQFLAERSLPITYRLTYQLHHERVALDGGLLGVVDERHPGVGEQIRQEIGQNREVYPGLTERGKHPLDVPQEQPVRAYDQDTLSLEWKTVGVEQIGGTMKGHDGLAGTGTTLHHYGALQFVADDLVLLALNRGHYVAKLAVAILFQGGHQGPVALIRLVETVEVEQLVLNVDQFPTPADEVATQDQPHRIPTGGPVEGLRHRGPPVDDDRLLVFVGHGQPPDVEPLTGLGVDPAEDQRGGTQLEAAQPVQDLLLDHVPLVAGLGRSPPPDLDHRSQVHGPQARLFEVLIGTVDVGLLRFEVGVSAQRINPFGPETRCPNRIASRLTVDLCSRFVCLAGR